MYSYEESKAAGWSARRGLHHSLPGALAAVRPGSISKTQVKEMYGVAYARTMAVAVLAGLPVALAYLDFQRRVTEGIMVTAGFNG